MRLHRRRHSSASRNTLISNGEAVMLQKYNASAIVWALRYNQQWQLRNVGQMAVMKFFR